MRLVLPLLATALVFAPAVARACAVCGFGEDESRVAYLGTTAFLSFLPLILIGGVVLYYWRHHMKTQRETGGNVESLAEFRDRR